jgi:hypothetical protein
MPKDDPAPPSPGSSPPDSVQECPADETKTSGNRIDIVFDPDKSKKVKKCEKIVHVQFVRNHCDGTVITGAKFSSFLSHKDDSVTSSDGWVLDFLASEKTPDYQQGIGNGNKNGGSVKATMSDAPTSGGGGDKGFYDPANNPGGWKTVEYEFAVFAWCMKGPDCGTWYEGVTWKYVETWEDARDGKGGKSTIIDKNVTSGPSAGQREAFDKFNKKKGFTPCT